jgi:hypothetical protein
MDNNKPLFKFNNAIYFLPSPNPLEKIEEQRIFRELHTSTLKLGDIWIPVKIGAKTCCVWVQFFLRCTKILSQHHPFLSFLRSPFLPCKNTFTDDYDGI